MTVSHIITYGQLEVQEKSRVQTNIVRRPGWIGEPGELNPTQRCTAVGSRFSNQRAAAESLYVAKGTLVAESKTGGTTIAAFQKTASIGTYEVAMFLLKKLGKPRVRGFPNDYQISSSRSTPSRSYWASRNSWAFSISSSLHGSTTRESATSSQRYFTSTPRSYSLFNDFIIWSRQL